MIPWILTSILAGGIIDFAMYRHFHFARYYPAAMLLSAFACILLLRAFDDPLKVAKGLLFAESLIYAGICDGISHDIPDWIMVPILAAGVLEFQPASSIEGFFSVSVLFYLFAKITDGRAFGGADIKLTAAAGWVLGLYGVVEGAVVGQILSVVSGLVFHIFNRKKQYYAMAPWLGIGYFLAYLLIPIGGIYKR